MKKNIYMLACLLVFSLTIAFSGTVFWDDGEIVRGTKINYALDEKVDQAGAAYVTLIAQSATPTAVIGRVFQDLAGDMYFLATGTTWTKLN